jgi:uncharacterized protein (DUF1810 family)
MNGASSQPATEDPFDLKRFVKAQEGVYERALAELRRGSKESHWMWFIFPQFEGLGHSSTSKHYAVKCVAEAKAYLQHPRLGQRLRECCEALLKLKGASAADVFGYPDDLKLRSSATLFAGFSDSDSVFARVLEQYFGGQPDPLTLELLKKEA